MNLIDTIIANLANVPLEDRENPQAVTRNIEASIREALTRTVVVQLTYMELKGGKLVEPRKTHPKPAQPVVAAQPEAPQPIVEPVAPVVPVPVVQDVQAPLEAVGAV